MNQSNNSVSVQLLDRTYQLKCEPEKASTLETAAAYLDSKMREIHDKSNAVGYERTTMLAAIDIAFELMCQRVKTSSTDDEIEQRLKSLQQSVEDKINASQLNLPQQTIGEQQKLAL